MAESVDQMAGTDRRGTPPGHMGAPGGERGVMAEAPFAIRQMRKSRKPMSAKDIPLLARKAWRFLILVEVTNFHSLRRHLGLPRADVLMIDVSARIAQCLPDTRLTVIARAQIEIAFEDDDSGAAEAALVALKAGFARPLDLDGESHVVQIIVGGVGTEAADCDDVLLVEGAEAALAQAIYQNGDVLRDLGAAVGAIDSIALMRDLPRAIVNGEMFLQYQPKVHVRRQEVASAEALVRWQHPVHGLVLPGDFIELAEQSGQIRALTLWTLRQVIADYHATCAGGHDMPMFINISGMLLADRSFVEDACAIVAASGARIGFEITETAVIRDPDVAIEHLNRFADIGIVIAIDDYGAGLSSLAYLKKLPATELKIDKMFVLQLTSSNRDPLIVRSTIDLAHALDMEVTAEGVETPAALALLSVMGCDMVQGFLVSRPVSLGAFHQYLNEQRHMGAIVDTRIAFNRPELFWKRG